MLTLKLYPAFSFVPNDFSKYIAKKVKFGFFRVLRTQYNML